MNKLFILLFSFLVLCPILYASDRISVGIQPHCYADNTEFFISPYKTGETILGSSVRTYFQLEHANAITLRLGAYLNFFYGDEKVPSQILPVFSFTYHKGTNFSFVFGSLDNASRHGLPDALLKEELDYTRESELGFQLKSKFPHFISDTWVNWNLLNTPDHKEYFDFGNSMLFPVWKFVFIFQSYISHHGGQLYHVGNFMQNIGLVAGLENLYDLAFLPLSKAGVSIRYMTEQPDKGLPFLGDGLLTEIFIDIFHFRIYADYWLGHNFVTEEGDPLYQTEKGWFFSGLKYTQTIADSTDFSAELRIHKYPFSPIWEYQYRFEFKSLFNILIKE